MKTEYILGNEVLDTVNTVFKNINDLVVPSMGAKSLYAVINDPMGQPTTTDDGVTIAKSIGNMRGYHQMVAKSIIEAAHNTEKEAYDGTTLTILLTYEIFKTGLAMIREGGFHPQETAEYLANEFMKVAYDIKKIDMKPEMVKSIATISTKIPVLGEAIEAAYKKAGEGMEVFIEHKPNNGEKISLVHTEGMSLNSGYQMQQLAEMTTDAKVAKLALLKDGGLSQVDLMNFFESIPDGEKTPIIYVVTRDVNPEAMRIIIDTHQKNQLPFNFLWITEALVDDIYLDLAMASGGKVRDRKSGVREYNYAMCGTVENLLMYIDKSSMTGTHEADSRIEYYNKILKDEDRKLQPMQVFLYEQRLASLKSGIVKLQIAAATQFEFTTIKLKLEDAIGAVRKSFEKGVVLGGGKALYNLTGTQKYDSAIQTILKEPHRRILKNAGLEEATYRVQREGIDVTTGKKVNLDDAGILDSYESVFQAIKNAVSISSNYLRAYALIKEED